MARPYVHVPEEEGSVPIPTHSTGRGRFPTCVRTHSGLGLVPPPVDTNTRQRESRPSPSHTN